MGRVIDIRPIFECRQLTDEKRREIAFHIALTVCCRLGVKPDGVMYKRYICALPSGDHRHAVVLWTLANAPELLESYNWSAVKEITARIDAHVRKVIPDDVFWSHD